MYIKENYNRDYWKDLLVLFSKRNFGRSISLEDEKSTIINHIPFKSIEYEPIIRGNLILLKLGMEQNELQKTIIKPCAISITKNKANVDLSMKITYSDNESLYIYFD